MKAFRVFVTIVLSISPSLLKGQTSTDSLQKMEAAGDSAGGGVCGDVVACVWASARDKIGAPASPKKKWRRFMVANSLSLRMSGNIYFRLNSWYDKT